MTGSLLIWEFLIKNFESLHRVTLQFLQVHLNLWDLYQLLLVPHHCLYWRHHQWRTLSKRMLECHRFVLRMSLIDMKLRTRNLLIYQTRKHWRFESKWVLITCQQKEMLKSTVVLVLMSHHHHHWMTALQEVKGCLESLKIAHANLPPVFFRWIISLTPRNLSSLLSFP